MDTMIILMLGTIAAGIVLGVLIGRISSRSESEGKIEEAFQKGKDEGEIEKANIALELGEQLLKMRDSIQQAVSAYDSTVQVVRERLAGSIQPGEFKDRLLQSAPLQPSIEYAGRGFEDEKNLLDIPAIDASGEEREMPPTEKSHSEPAALDARERPDAADEIVDAEEAGAFESMQSETAETMKTGLHDARSDDSARTNGKHDDFQLF